MEQEFYRSKNYKVVVRPDASGKLTYCIVNTKSEVVETETSLLPQAIKYASDLEAGLAAIIDITSAE